MSNTFVLAQAGENIRNTPVITLDQNTSAVLTDSIGRQTIVSVSPPVPTIPISLPVISNISGISSSLYSQPISLPPILDAYSYSYQDINSDPELHQKVMKKIYTNFYNFVIPNQYPYLLNYIKKNKGSYSMVKNTAEYKKNKTKENEYENKLQYIARNVYSKMDMYKDIQKFLDTYDIKWYDIEDSKKEVYDLLCSKLKKKLEDLV